MRICCIAGLLLTLTAPGTTTGHAGSTNIGSWRWLNPLPQGNSLNGISCADGSICYAVGDAGTALVTSDDGNTWRRLSTGSTRDLVDIACPTRTVCYALGTAGMIFSTQDGGMTWTRQSVGARNDLQHIVCPSTSTCYVKGFDLTKFCAAPGCDLKGAQNVILATRDSGRTWDHLSSGATATLFGIACPSPSTCLTGYGHTILATMDGGTTWHVQGVLPKDLSFGPIVCPSDTVCYVLGNDVILATDDTGHTWKIRKQGGEFRDINCPTEAVCYVAVADGTVLKTVDAGLHWQSEIAATDAYPYIGMYAITCASTRVCHALAAYGSIISTNDSGLTWRDYSHGFRDDLFGITCFSREICRVLATHDLLATDDGGQTWSQESIPLATNPGNPAHMACPSSTICYLVWHDATILRTENTGKTWQKQANQLSGTALNLSAIACPGIDTCYAVGTGCLVDGCPGNRVRSVVLATTDGGRTWRRRYTRESNSLILQAIACPAVRTCYVVGSPAKILATTNGGRTWHDQPNPMTDKNTNQLNGITCASTKVCYVVGRGCTASAFSCPVFEVTSTILATNDRGSTWRSRRSNRTMEVFGSRICGSKPVCRSGVPLNGVACSSATTCFAAGLNGAIVATSNGGRTWRSQNTDTHNDLHAIACPAHDTCYAVGRGGTVITFTTWMP